MLYTRIRRAQVSPEDPECLEIYACYLEEGFLASSTAEPVTLMGLSTQLLGHQGCPNKVLQTGSLNNRKSLLRLLSTASPR